MKKTIHLEAMDPLEIFGAQNKILTEFCSYFPHLKVTARGTELILEGRESDIAEFNIRFAELVEKRHHKMNLTVYDVEDIFSGAGRDEQHHRPTSDAIIVHGTDGKPIRARNKTQQDLISAYFENDLIFAVGPAGTGKTYMAIALAVRALKNREIKRIILTRPAVEAGERLGFLPGDLKDKLDPYLQPLYDALSDGFSNDDECRKYFEESLKIDLEDLFRRCEFGLQSPSQMLAATLKTYWFDGWLRGSQRETLSKMLGDGSFEEMVDMLHSLFVKYEVERRVAQTIHRYVDTFGIDVKELSEMIADICAEMINKFVLSVGYDYYSREEGVVDNLKDASSKHKIELNFHFVDEDTHQASNSHIATLMAEMDDMDRTRLMLMHPDEHSIDDLSAVIPGFRQSCRWRDLAKIGFVLTNDIPHYDVEANELLGRIIEKCRTLNNK